MASVNPFAITRSNTDHTYLRFLQRWRDMHHEKHLNILSALCDRNMELADLYGPAWYKLDEWERAAMDDQLAALYAQEQQNMRVYLASVQKLEQCLTSPH